MDISQMQVSFRRAEHLKRNKSEFVWKLKPHNR